MEPESPYDEVITRYLLNEASPEEEQFVLKWMAHDVNNRLYVEDLQSTLHLINATHNAAKLNVDEEWKQFRRNVVSDKSPVMPLDPYRDTDWEDTENAARGRVRIKRILIGSAIAASVIFIIGVSTGWFADDVVPNPITAQKKNINTEAVKIDPLMAIVQHEVNTSGKTKQLILPDGSQIALSDNSELTYKEPVDGKHRNVYLVGKADFQVAKNKSKPFTVFSEELSTTAIGTRFSVTAKKSDKTIRIKLYEGKVVVRSLTGYNKSWTGQRYLIPGQELVYDRQQKTISVTPFSVEKKSSRNVVNQAKENPSIPHFDKRSWFMFNNQPLSEIFEALAEMYDVKILYTKSDVKDMYFIGTYDKSDSLDKILKQIALLNDLKVTQQNDAFKIEKQKQKK